jgi:hypothetical protein
LSSAINDDGLLLHMSILLVLLHLLQRKSSPAQLPASWPGLVIAAAILTLMLNLILQWSGAQFALRAALLAVLLGALVIFAVLYLRSHAERFVQTAFAEFACSALVATMMYAGLWLAGPVATIQAAIAPFVLVWIIVLAAYGIWLRAFIWSQATDLIMPSAVMVAIALSMAQAISLIWLLP